MKQRWLVAVLGLPLILIVLLLCPMWATMLLMAVLSGIAAWELLHVTGKGLSKPLYAAAVFLAAMQTAVLYGCKIGALPAAALYGAAWAAVMFFFFLAVVTYGKENAVPFSTVSAGIVGCVVFPLLYGCVLLLRMEGRFALLYVLMPFVIAFAGDSLAMYFGMWFGKKKMAPHVSPNKTWAGFWGNLLGSGIGMLLLGLIGSRWLGYAPSWPMLALAGVAGNLFGQLGDLSTSLIKREHGVKDYSHLFLTHGGVLDRFDSMLFIAPVVYFFVSNGAI